MTVPVSGGNLTRTAKVTHVDFESDRPGADPCPVIRLLENLARSLTFLSPLVVKCGERRLPRGAVRPLNEKVKHFVSCQTLRRFPVNSSRQEQQPVGGGEGVMHSRAPGTPRLWHYASTSDRPALKRRRHLATVPDPQAVGEPLPIPSIPPGRVVLTLTICGDEVLHLGLLVPWSPARG